MFNIDVNNISPLEAVDYYNQYDSPVYYVLNRESKATLTGEGLKFYGADNLRKSYRAEEKDFVIDIDVLERKIGKSELENILNTIPKEEKPDKHELIMKGKKARHNVFPVPPDISRRF